MNALLKARWILAGRTLLAGLVVSVAALAGGCTPATPASPPSAPSPSGTEWVISSAGIGPYKIGDPFEVDLPEGDGYACALKMVEDAGHGGVWIADDSFGWTWYPKETTHALRITRVEVGYAGDGDPLPVRTAEGAGIGSTRAEVLAAYPDAVPSSSHRYDAVVITRDGVPIAFSFGMLDRQDQAPPSDSDRVEVVVVGADAPIYEVCA